MPSKIVPCSRRGVAHSLLQQGAARLLHAEAERVRRERIVIVGDGAHVSIDPERCELEAKGARIKEISASRAKLVPTPPSQVNERERRNPDFGRHDQSHGRRRAWPP